MSDGFKEILLWIFVYIPFIGVGLVTAGWVVGLCVGGLASLYCWLFNKPH